MDPIFVGKIYAWNLVWVTLPDGDLVGVDWSSAQYVRRSGDEFQSAGFDDSAEKSQKDADGLFPHGPWEPCEIVHGPLDAEGFYTEIEP